MIKSLLAIWLILLLFPMVSIMIVNNAQGQVDIEIKVAINVGDKHTGTYFKQVNETLNGYSWVVNDTEYNFTTYFVNINDIDAIVNGSYSVHIIDGLTDEFFKCIRKLGPNDNILRDKLHNSIYSTGVGYIGRCGGSILASTHSESRPNNIYQYYWVKRNAFLKKPNEVKMYINAGVAIRSQYFEMKYLLIPRPGFRIPQEPAALGQSAYGSYGSNLEALCYNLTDLDKTHPILKDYYGETLYTRSGGGGFPQPPDDVSVIAYYPAKCAETDPDQVVHSWRFKPKLYHLRELGEYLIYLIFDDDVKEENFKELYKEWEVWHQTSEIIRTGLQNLPAIIAFDYGNGRIVLSPHTAANIWSDEAYIEETDYNGEGVSTSQGLFHWYITEGDKKYKLDKYNHTIPNKALWWYQRREAAWVAKEKIPDDHLPPVYNRSHVVDFDKILQNSTEFSINCTVGKENNTTSWNWNSNLNLTLYYKWKSIYNDPWPEDWIPYETIYGRPYNFTFNSPNGSGYYCFCSILNTNESGIWTCDEFPPEPDAETAVTTDIEAYFLCQTQYAYTNAPVQFDSSDSATAPGTKIDSYHWQFDDGEESYDPNPLHTFDDDGEYDVVLTVENNASNIGIITKTIVVHNRAPETDFEPGFKVVFVNETVNFTDNSNDSDGNLSKWLWDFDDGTNATVQNINHSYPVSGYYEISLEVTDDDNSTNVTSGGILVIDTLVNKTKTQQGKIWNKLQDAVDNASSGDVIYIENGTFSENVIINKSITIIGEDRNNVVITGSVSMVNPYDYELPENCSIDLFILVNMTGNELLMHFNNDSDVGENYYTSDFVFDYSENGNNGTNNGALWTTSTLKGAGAFDFNGTNNSINLNSITGFTGENVTVSSWVYWTGGTGIADPIISQSNATLGYCLYVNNTTGKPVFRLDDMEAVSNINLTSNKWHHIAGTHNETTLKIYVDGVLRGNTSKTGSGFNTDCYIGFDNLSSYFNGRIDEVAVWNHTLPDDDIRLIYDSNFGICLEGVTIRDSNVGITVCNHSEIAYCLLVNHTVGVLMNNSSNVGIYMCNISDVDTGININDSNPEFFYYNIIDSCMIDNVTSAIVVNSSSYLDIINTMVNGSNSNLSFSNCDFDTMYVINCNSPNNVAPDLPYVSGPSMGEINTSYTFSAVTNDSNGDQILYYFDWDDGNSTGWLSLYSSNETVNASHTWMEDGNYQVQVTAKDVFNNESNCSESLFIIDILPPVINSVNSTPDPGGLGGNITITANVTDDESGGYSGVQTVKVNISLSGDSFGNFTMSNTVGSVYEYVFSDCWLVGQYNYSIWVCDNSSHSNYSSGYSFNVSGQASMSVCTVKDAYGGNEMVNITDPPGPPFQQIGYDLLDDDSVLHVWNRFDSYYFNTSNGVQFTNHYDEYWSHNVLMLGYYDNDVWNLIYRSDELSGFNKNVTSDNISFVNATLWKDLSYEGYDFRLAIRYHLGVNDNELTVIPYIKNIDDEDIPYVLGFAWEINDIQVDITPEDDYIEINGSSYNLNETLDLTFSNMSIPVYCWNNETNESYVCGYIPMPYYYIREDKTSNCAESLYLRWNESLNYKVKIKSKESQYNAPVTLGIKIGTLAMGKEKFTSLFWHDASEVTYYFNGYNTSEAWSTNPSYMVDGNISNYASTSTSGDVEYCDNNTCSGDDLGDITKVELRVYGYYSVVPNNIILRPVFNGTDGGNNYTVELRSTPSWSRWRDITGDLPGPGGGLQPSWEWSDVVTLGCDVEAKTKFGVWTLYCSKVEVRVTYNQLPVISNPFPADGSTGISISPVLNITVSDPEGDLMNITWLSNSSDSWVAFGSNYSVSNGTYHQTMSNASVNGQWWYWKVNVSDGISYTESSVYKFYTGNQSKIENTGSTNISGYLLMQVQLYNTSLEEWVVANDTVNETSPMTINVSGVLGLDTIFNGIVNTSDLSSFGSGTYRVYTVFRDPNGNILVCDDETEMIATYEFTITFD